MFAVFAVLTLAVSRSGGCSDVPGFSGLRQRINNRTSRVDIVNFNRQCIRQCLCQCRVTGRTTTRGESE